MPKIVGFTRGMVLCQKMRDFCDDPRTPRFDKYRPYLGWFTLCPVKELKNILNDVRTDEELSDICDILVRHHKFLDNNLVERVWKTQVECDLTARGYSVFGESIRAKIVANGDAILGTRKSFEVLDWYMGCLERHGKQTSEELAKVKEESEKAKKELRIEKHNQKIRNIRNAYKTREDIENLKAKIVQLEKPPEIRMYQRILDKNYEDMIANLKTTLDLLLQRHPDSMEILEAKLEVLRFAGNLENYLANVTMQLERCRANLSPNSSVEQFPSVRFCEKYARLTRENGVPNFLEQF